MPTVAIKYDHTLYISLTFTALTRKQYHSDNVQDTLINLIVSLLGLHDSPLIILEHQGSINTTSSVVVVYFPSESTSTAILQSYAELLTFTDKAEWTNFKQCYVSSSHYIPSKISKTVFT